MAEIESLKEKRKRWGGARPGAGRKLHSKNPATVKREEAKRQFQERVAKHADKIFNAQLDLAVGEKYLMVVKTIGTGNRQHRETSIVTDTETIKQYLDEELDSTDTEFYFMSTKPANNNALDSLLSRSFGKADEKLDITTDGKSVNAIADPEAALKYAEFLKQRT